jgi:D-lactate dehydrogenase
MRVALYSAHRFDRQFFDEANAAGARAPGRERHEIAYLEARLTPATCALADGFPVVCAFVNDQLDADVLARLQAGGARMIALRSAGFNHVDLPKARALGLRVARVPAYSPHAVAEHTVALILALNRKICRAYGRVRDGNYALDGLLGFDLHGRVVGIVGTGQIGTVVARILSGFGCRLLGFDPEPNEECRALGLRYAALEEIWAESDIITLHAPLTPGTRHLIDAAALAAMKRGVMLINTGRGALVDTRAVIASLKTGHIGYLGLDVYEEEEKLFFEDRSMAVLQDDVFARLLTFPNVIITAHQAFFTREAMRAIAETTLDNISAFERGEVSGREL